MHVLIFSSPYNSSPIRITMRCLLNQELWGRQQEAALKQLLLDLGNISLIMWWQNMYWKLELIPMTTMEELAFRGCPSICSCNEYFNNVPFCYHVARGLFPSNVIHIISIQNTFNLKTCSPFLLVLVMLPIIYCTLCSGGVSFVGIECWHSMSASQGCLSKLFVRCKFLECQ